MQIFVTMFEFRVEVILLLNSQFLVTPGRNDKGQLGHGDTKRLEAPKLIEALADHLIVAAACGRNHTLALTGMLSHDVHCVVLHAIMILERHCNNSTDTTF